MASLPEAPASANKAADATKQKLLQAVESFDYSKASREVLLDVDAAAVIEAPALVGRTIRVYWPAEDAWFLGTVTSYNCETGEHHVDYVDGDQLDHIIALGRVRILITQGADLPKPSAAAMNAYCALLEQRAMKIRATEPEDAAELVRRAAELRAGTAVGSPGTENRCSAYRPGDVVWGKCRSFPPWPAMVVTRQLVSSLYRKPPAGKYLNSYPVVYFGSFEYEWRDEKDLTPMREGIDKDFHLGRTIKRRQFAAAICEATAYMADGEVPELMFPCNDELESDGEEDEEEEEEARPKKKGGKSSEKQSEWSGVVKEPGMPLKLPKKLTVFSLGRVEWLHPSFHDEKSIWPVGYKAERLVTTPAAGGKKPTRHLFEVLEAPDGSGPIFRITPWGKPSVQGRTPHKAWMALFQTPDSNGSISANSNGLVVGNGAKQFGLTVPQVAAAIMALPGSNRCERFAGWLDGEIPPPPPPLNTEEERKRLAYEAAACRLPEGVTGIPAAPTAPGTCYVCYEEEEDEEDLILQCDGCGIFTHMTCYGVHEPPHGHLWLCDTCKVGAAFSPSCAICPVIGGALKRTDCGRWVHPSCVIWLPENTYLNRELSYHNLQGLVTGLSSVHSSRRKLTCQICKIPHGACMQCCDPGCYAAFHIMCARQTEGYALQILADSDSEEEEDVEDNDGEKEKEEEKGLDGVGVNLAEKSGAGDAAAIVATGIVEDGGIPSPSGSGDENGEANAAAAAGAAAAGAVCNKGLLEDNSKPTATNKKRGRPAVPPGTKKKKVKYQMVRGKRRAVVTEGTKINGARLVVFCPKHRPEGHIQPTLVPPVVNPALGTEGGALGTAAAAMEQHNNTATASGSEAENKNLLFTAANNNGMLVDGRSSAAGTLPSSSLHLLKTSVASTAAGGGLNSTTTATGADPPPSFLRRKVIDEATLEKASAAVAGWLAPTPQPQINNSINNSNNGIIIAHAARAMPFDGSLGRGPRAPEAMEAGLAKRYYIDATPLLVRGPVPELLDPPKSTCTWHLPQNSNNGSQMPSLVDGGSGGGSGRCGGVQAAQGSHAAADAVGGSVAVGGNAVIPAAGNAAGVPSTCPKVMEPERKMLKMSTAGASQEDEDIEIMQKEQPSTAANITKNGNKMVDTGAAAENLDEKKGKLSISQPLPPPSGSDIAIAAAEGDQEEDIMSKPITSNNTTTSVTTITGSDDNALVALKTATAPRITPDRKTVLSSTERYREMRATESLRIAPGKSAIHGWGAFARLPHTKDQMVIEYVGDLVRPSVADARERQVYDSLVGAGTYVFRVNMGQCVDATRSGNLAHLLNHSCEPNCYSRTVPVWDKDKGQAVDHVVIFAAREIATWEELTYDYRFSGEEKLICNCGAVRCRGMVNQASTGPGGGVAIKGTMVPESQVKYPFRN